MIYLQIIVIKNIISHSEYPNTLFISDFSLIKLNLSLHETRKSERKEENVRKSEMERGRRRK